MSVELGSFWLIKDSGCIAIVRSIIGKSNGGLTVVYTVTDNSGVSSYRMSCEYELFTNIAEKLITKSELKDDLNKEYVKGKTDGYNEGYQHGFTLAKEKITELENEQRKIIESYGYNNGYEKATAEFELGNNFTRELEDKYFQKGYNTAIEEMSNSKSLGEEWESISILDFGAIDEGYKREIYPVTEGIDIIKFIKDNFDNIKSFTQVGAVASIEMFDKNNSGVCGSNVPNKETQEAMQEVLDKDSNDFTGIWVSKQHNPDWKLEYYSDCGTHVWMKVLGTPDLSVYIVGELFTMSKDSLKKDYTRLLEDSSVENTNKDEQLEKELALVEKYPHYYKDIRHLNIIDIYRFFDLFEVTDPCIQHSMKKLAVGGKRGAKDYEKDIKEAMDTLKRWEYMQEENKRGLDD